MKNRFSLGTIVTLAFLANSGTNSAQAQNPDYVWTISDSVQNSVVTIPNRNSGGTGGLDVSGDVTVNNGATPPNNVLISITDNSGTHTYRVNTTLTVTSTKNVFNYSGTVSIDDQASTGQAGLEILGSTDKGLTWNANGKHSSVILQYKSP